MSTSMPADRPVAAARVPYPGLRPFREDESDLFFGRERQVDDLLDRLSRHRFIAVTGPSGCGKSSLVTAGVIPALDAGFMAGAGSRWRVAQMRPGDSPVRALAAALAVPEIVGEAWQGAASADYLDATLRFGPLGLAQIVRESPELRSASLFLLVDQFEEIFRFRERIDPDEADAFVQLLLATARQPDLPVYIVITMRSDYLGDCTVFGGLPEAINDSQFLTPRLTRDECGEAIRGPARACRGDVDGALLHRLLNDFGPDPDQLPLLQHALMRMWRRRAAEKPAPSAGDRLVLTLDDYAEPLGLALDRHAEEVYASLSPEQQRLAELLFRRLTERARGRRDTRAPARLDEVAAVAGVVDVEPVRAVVEAFRREGCNFIVARDAQLVAGSLLDIGHESLIRQWKRLSALVDVEAESAATYLRLADSAARHADGQEALLWQPALQQAIDWLDREQPTAAWAQRYALAAPRLGDGATAFERMQAFVESSRISWEEHLARERQREQDKRDGEIAAACRQAEAEAARADQRRAEAELKLAQAQHLAASRQWRHLGLGALVGLLLLVVLGFVGLADLRSRILTGTPQTYASFVSVRGIPKGLGPPLTSEQRSRRPSSYEITAKCEPPTGVMGDLLRWVDGRLQMGLATAGGTCPGFAVVTGMRAVDARGELAIEHGARLSGLAESEVAEGRRGVRWEYVYDDKWRIAYEVEFNRKGERVRSLVYEPATGDDSPTSRVRQLLGPGGYPLAPAKDMCAAFSETVEFSSPQGFEWRYRYTDKLGEAVPGRDNVWVQEELRDERGFLVETVALHDRDGGLEPVDNAEGYARVRYAGFDDFGEYRVAQHVAADGSLVENADGVAVLSRALDGYGNAIEQRNFNRRGQPTASRQGWHRWTAKLDSTGHASEDSFWAADGSPATQETGCHRLRWTRNAAGRVTEGACIGRDGQPSAGALGAPVWRIESDVRGNRLAWSYWSADGRTPVRAAEGWHRLKWGAFGEHGKATSERFLDERGQPIRLRTGQSGLRSEYDKRGYLVARTYLGPDGSPDAIDDGYTSYRFVYDDNGYLMGERYLSVDGKPARRDSGYAGADFRRDACGRERESWYLDPDGRPMTITNGYAGERSTYDQQGRRIELRYLTPEGRPAVDSDRVAGFRERHDRWGRVVERLYLDPMGRPVANADGTALVRTTRDLRGHEESEEHLGTDGRPVATRGAAGSRHARVEWVRDALGRVLEEAYFGVRGEPVYVEDGYARVRRVLDAAGRITEESYHGAQGEPAIKRNGVHRQRRTYDDMGALAETRDFGLRDQPMDSIGGYHREVFDMDAQGRVIRRRLFAADGREATSGAGWHERRNKYDPQGRLVAQSLWGPGGSAYVDGNGVHEWRWRPDAHGRVLEWAYFAPRHLPVRGPDGAYVVRAAYDARGRKVEQTYWTAGAQQRMASSDGESRSVWRYDDLGRELRVDHFDRDDQPVGAPFVRRTMDHRPGLRIETFYAASARDGEPLNAFARATVRIDPVGRPVAVTWDDGRGQPSTGNFENDCQACAAFKWKYDAYGRAVDLARYDLSRTQPARVAFDSRELRRYDARGRMVERLHVDERGELSATGNGVAIERYRFDDHGRMVEARLFDSRRTLGPEGSAAVVLLRYDARGRKVFQGYRDRDLRPLSMDFADGQGTRQCTALTWKYDQRGRTEDPAGECVVEPSKPQAPPRR